MDITLRENIKNIEYLFDCFNRKFYNNELEKPVITMIPNASAKKLALGWCSTKKFWINKDSNEGYYEISICPEFMDRNIYEISETLLHEMVHLYNVQHDIQDCSRNNTYHNKKFKQLAEEKGLQISFNKKYGWHDTKLKPETMEWITKNLNIHLIPLVRGGLHISQSDPDKNDGNNGQNENIEVKKKKWKYVCPVCGNSVRATKEVHVICGDCNETMEES